eukprot:7412212-Karenia_brevis.AAC.1
MSKGAEWAGVKETIYYGEGDVAHAFDNCTPEITGKALSTRGLHPWLIAAMLEESCDIHATFNFRGIASDEPFCFSRCIRQGGKEGPFNWNCLMLCIMGPLHSTWKDNKWGVMLNGRWHTHIIYADNIVILADNLEHF